MSKLISLGVSAVILAGALVPAAASAQTSGNGLLSVYVQVVNPSGSTVAQRNPGDFNVLVAGQSPSPSTFVGSINGVQVSLGAGTYSVAVSGNQWGYTPSYSQGCTGTISAGGTGLCVITMNPQYNNYPYPAPYPFPYTTPSLSCAPAHQSAGLRQNVSFTAQGGVGGTYNWMTPGHNYPNVGPVLTVSFDGTGSQLVTVTNGAQSATCEVTINNSYYPTTSTVYPTYPTTSTIYPTYPTYPQTPTLYPTYTPYPQLPNTGIEPMTALQMALALVLLSGVALVVAPYVRKAFAIVVR